MGSFAGHLLPGLSFLVYGLWWMFVSYWQQLANPSRPIAKGKSASGGVSYAEFKRETELSRKSYIPQPFWSKVPLEPLSKVILCSVGIIGEGFFDVDQKTGHLYAVVYQIRNESGDFNNQSKMHHITMYLAFAVSGIVDLIIIFIRVPRNTSKLFFANAFLLEGLLFWFHAHGRADLDLMLHTLLNYSIAACFSFAALRMWQPLNLLVNVGLSFSMMLQGTWFINLGVILYVQNWDMEDHNNVMFAIASYSWIIIGVMTFMLIAYVLMLACLKSSVKYRKGRRRGLRFLSTLPGVLAEEGNHGGVPEESKNLMDGTGGEERELGLLHNKTMEESHA